MKTRANPPTTSTKRRAVSSSKKNRSGTVIVGPYCVGVVGEGGTAEAGDHGVAIAGLTAAVNTSPRSYARAGDNGYAITTDEGEATAGTYGIAAAGKNGIAQGGAGVMATVGEGKKSLASVGDGGMARVTGYLGTAMAGSGVAYCQHKGTAIATDHGTALVEQGRAQSGNLGIASNRGRGYVRTGDRGVSVGWEETIASAGAGGVIILGYRDPMTDALRLKVGQMQPDGPLTPGLNYMLNKKFDFMVVKK